VNDITFHIMLIAKKILELDSYQFDVETAFLLGELEEESTNSTWDLSRQRGQGIPIVAS